MHGTSCFAPPAPQFHHSSLYLHFPATLFPPFLSFFLLDLHVAEEGVYVIHSPNQQLVDQL